MDEGVNFGKMSRRSQEIVNKAYAAMRDAQTKGKGRGGGQKASSLVPSKVTEGVVVHQSDNTFLMRYLYEGDGYVASAKFESARRAYENQVPHFPLRKPHLHTVDNMPMNLPVTHPLTPP